MANINIGQGVAAGVEGFIKGSQQAQDRNIKQQQLTQQAEQLGLNRQAAASQQDLRDIQIQQAQFNLQNQMKKVANAKTREGLFNAFDKGTLTDLNYTIKNDENFQNLFPGIDNIEKIDINRPEYANQAAGMESPILVTSVRDGKIVREVRDLEALKLRTGYTNYKQKRDLETTTSEQKIIKSDLMVTALETGDPQEVMHAYMMTNPEKFLGAGGSQRRDSLAQEVEAFGKGNPNATPKEWEGFYKRYSEKKDIGTGGRRESEDIIELSTEQKKAEKVSKAPPKEFNIAEARDTENKIFAKLDEKKKKSVQEDIDKMKSNFHLSNNLNRILTTVGETIDKDAVADAKTFVEKKLGKESAQSMANIDFNTRSGIILANFMKEMSGTAVADAEVNRLRNILLGGDLTDETYVRAAIASFASELQDQNIELGSTLGDTAPYSVNKYTTKKESATKPSAADFD